MKPVDNFSLSPLAEGESAAYRSRLFCAGMTGPVVEGTSLEGQFVLPDGRYLLLLSDDCPYEERVHVLLLSPGLEPLDALELGAPYNPGMVSAVNAGDAAVEFDFAGRRYRVAVLAAPRRRLELHRAPGVRRRGSPWRKRHLGMKVVNGGR